MASSRLMDRRTLLSAVPLVLGLPRGGSAQSRGPLGPERLEALITQALKGGQARFKRPEILGLKGENVYYRGVASEDPAAAHYLSVVVPEIEDGLLFFRGTEKPKWWFAMHRTGRHLRRIVSARNADGNLTVWTGQDADRDFLAQLTFWAKND